MGYTERDGTIVEYGKYHGEDACAFIMRNGIVVVHIDGIANHQRVIKLNNQILKDLEIKEDTYNDLKRVTITHKNDKETHSLSLSAYDIEVQCKKSFPFGKEECTIILPEFIPFTKAYAVEKVEDSKGNLQEYQYAPYSSHGVNIRNLLKSIHSHDFIKNLSEGYQFSFDITFKDKLIPGKDKAGRNCVFLKGSDIVVNGEIIEHSNFLKLECSNMQSDSRLFNGKMKEVIRSWKKQIEKEIEKEKTFMPKFKFKDSKKEKVKESLAKFKEDTLKKIEKDDKLFGRKECIDNSGFFGGME